jgi:hypothetical protein
MKERKLASLLALTMSFQMMVSPVLAVAQEEGGGKARRSSNGATTATNVAAGVGAVIQSIGQIYSEVKGQQPQFNPQLAGDMQKLQGQMSPQPDKHFNAQKLMQIPGLANYLALNNINPATLNCQTLPTTLHEANPEVCRLGMTADKGVAQVQMQQMFSYHNQYFQISKIYRNFTADSNAGGQSFGVGCMKSAMNVLKGFFKYRIDELDKLTTNIEAMQNEFKKASRSDLDAIEEASAVLDGDSALANKVRSKKPDLFEFGKRFNNPACGSMFAGDKLNQMGRDGGLNAINSDVKKTLSTKTGKFSGESYAQNHTAVLEDLEGLADKVSKQFQLNFPALVSDPRSNAYGAFLADLQNAVSSPNGSNRALSPDLFADTRTKFNEQMIKLNEQKSTILSELGSARIDGKSATELFGHNTSSNFDAEVNRIENGLKNKCFQDSLSSMNKDKILRNIYDPTASKHANKYASNYLKDKLAKILDNNATSLEKKLAELKLLEEQSGGKYFMRMENSYEVQEVDDQGNLKTEVVTASQARTPSLFFSDLIRNCNAQFRANKLDNKMSGAGAVQKLRELNQDYKKLGQSQAADMKKEVRRKLIECSSPQEANNTTPGSCTPERFNTSASGFCANAAFSCSKNMQECAKQADGYVKEIKEQRTARVNNYKALVEKNKDDMEKMFKTALSGYMRDGEMLRGMFGAGFSSPTDIKYEVNPAEKYLGDFQQATSRSIDGQLLLEDPEQFTKMFKENIEKLKVSVAKQQDQVLGGETGSDSRGLLAQHVALTEKNYKEVINGAEKISNTCLAKHDGAIQANEQQRMRQQQEYEKKMSELGEKRNEFCNTYGMAKSNPKGACSENLRDVVKSGYQGVSAIDPRLRADAMQNVDDFYKYCADNSPEDKAGIGWNILCQDAVEEKPLYLTDKVLKEKVKKLCDDKDKIDCKPVINNAVTTSSDCENQFKRIYAEIEGAYSYQKRKLAAGNGGGLKLEETPAYCSAGFDSPDRLAKSIHDGINGTMGIIGATKKSKASQE